MASFADPHDEKSEQASCHLEEGLRSCRAVLSSYRALLARDSHDDQSEAGFIETSAANQETALRI